MKRKHFIVMQLIVKLYHHLRNFQYDFESYDVEVLCNSKQTKAVEVKQTQSIYYSLKL